MAKQATTKRAAIVYRQLVRGLTPPEIAESEGIPVRTVYWLIKEGNRVLGGQFEILVSTGLVKLLFANQQERRRELWALFTSTQQDAVQVSCLARLAEEDDRLLALARGMGVRIEPPPSGGAVEDLLQLLDGVLSFSEKQVIARAIRRRLAAQVRPDSPVTQQAG